MEEHLEAFFHGDVLCYLSNLEGVWELIQISHTQIMPGNHTVDAKCCLQVHLHMLEKKRDYALLLLSMNHMLHLDNILEKC